MPERAKCRSCGADILWVRSSATDALIPIDADPNASGDCLLIGENVVVARGDLFEPMMDGDRHTQHADTCPEMAKHRQAKKEKGKK